MKKFILVALAALFVCSAVDAQILRADELEKYAKEKYGEKWVDAATNLGTQLTLDKNNAITYTQVIPAEGKTKDQLYVLLNYWFTATSMMRTPSSNCMTRNWEPSSHRVL